MRIIHLLTGAAMAALCSQSAIAQAPAPLRVLIVSGGGFHDYPRQRALLEEGLEARLNVEVSHIFADPPPERSTRPAIPAFTNPAYGDGYDVIVHDECAADEGDPAVLDAILAPHRAGIPAVALHCAMHSFRSGTWREAVARDAQNARWFALTGIQSTGHGPQQPIAVTYTDHPISRDLQPWTTPDEELYNNLTRFDVTPVAIGTQPSAADPAWRGPVMLAWTHEYGPAKARIFSTTLAHNEDVMADPRYLDLVARGLAWASGHLDEHGQMDDKIRKAE